MSHRELFLALYNASTEAQLDQALKRYPTLQEPTNWRAYGGNQSNFGVVENQQSSSIPALVEKIVNAIDAILMKQCLERGIVPSSRNAPGSIEEAINQFFPEARNWDLSQPRKEQAMDIQILADGPRRNSSLIVYDNGEGQHPEDFEDTFLSLLRGNKNEIHFVQGKYNMGGAGAIVFCGKKRYQLIGSRRYDRSGDFGFTLMRQHPLTDEERANKKNTWYEYLVIDDRIPSFSIEAIDLGLYKKQFTTGTVIKLYSYDLPAGSRSVISRDLNQSLNEYLFQPALPVYTIDNRTRFPHDRNLEREFYGLKRRLERTKDKYLEEFFSEEFSTEEVGEIRIVVYVFRPRIDGKNATASSQSIRREFFKNNMSVLFSLHGQVHGHYTSEFITRSLKFPLLKNSLLIHVDCTDVRLEFRNELFMASRDRLKDGAETRKLRRELAKVLSTGRLKEVYKRRKTSISVDSKETDDLLKSFAEKLPLQSELMELLGHTLRLDEREGGKSPSRRGGQGEVKKKSESPPFRAQRFPSFFKLDRASADGVPLIKIPLGGQRSLPFATDVEDNYFDRIDEPGNLTLSILGLQKNDGTGGDQPGLPRDIREVLNVTKASPHNGTIRVTLNPTQELKVGDTLKIRAQLSAPGEKFEEIFLVKITDPKKRAKEKNNLKEASGSKIGLPKLILANKGERSGRVTWEVLDEQGIEIGYDVVMYPLVEGDVLKEIYINMDSRTLLNYRSGLSSEEAISLAEHRYISAVYFHTLFLYMITRRRKYHIVRIDDQDDTREYVDLTEYLRDIFQSHYAEFLLNFEVSDLVDALES